MKLPIAVLWGNLIDLQLRAHAGQRFADLDRRIAEESITALNSIGLWHAAALINSALDYTLAYGEMHPPPRFHQQPRPGAAHT